MEAEPESLFENFPLPAIAHVVIDEVLLHYVVIHRITREEILSADPAKGMVKYTPEEFYNTWTGILILLVPSQTFEIRDEKQGIFSRFIS